MANTMNEGVFKELSEVDRDWVLYSMVTNIQIKQISIENRLKKLENRKLMDRGLNVGAGAVGGSVTMFFIWLKSQIWPE